MAEKYKQYILDFRLHDGTTHSVPFNVPIGDPGVHFGSDHPPDTATVWVDPNGEPTSTEDWDFTLYGGTTETKRVVVVGAEEENGHSGILRLKDANGVWREIPALIGPRGFRGVPGVYVGSETPPDDAMVWVNPDGEPTSTEDWEFAMEDGSRDTKRVVVVGAEESNGYSGILMVRQEDGSWKEIPAIAGSNSGGNVELDTTLTQSGKAADAKAVGDKIAEITGISLVEPAEDDMPKVFITGVKPTTKDDVLAEMQYISKTDSFHAYLEIKCQGTSSMSWPKKNFTVKLYSDEARETKLKKDFKDWNHPGNKFVLKANYIDHSHARNIVSARLWNEVVKSRSDYDSLPEEMRNSPRNGAVDGFPIKVYYNGTYEGVYTWNIGKEDWMWGMNEDNPNHVLLCAETNTDGVYRATPCNFRALWSGVDETDWSVEVGTNSTALKTSLNNLIQFVMDNDGDAFHNGISNYLDIQSAIDYYIFQYEICGLDGLAKNMLLATYDLKVWHCGAYDLDSTFGLWWNGSKFVPATYACPEDYQEEFSLLWERIETNFLPELKARQAELRKTVLSYSNMVTHFERFMDIIGLDLYAEDLSIYTGIPSGSTNNIKQIRNYIRDRQAYVDAEFAVMSGPVPCTGISLNTNMLTFTEEGSQTLIATVTPDGCTDPVTWDSNNTSVATVIDGIVTAVANGSATITAYCGEFSASCSVAVSGIAEPVPCTGITLDKTELTFNGDGTQTITATVTPSDTTDSVVWVSSAPAVASIAVEGNICTVQSVRNGNAVITVTCGNYSASCNVVVKNKEFNLFSGVTWGNGYVGGTGVITENTTDVYSSLIDVSDYVGQTFIYNALNPSGSRFVFFDASEVSIGSRDIGGICKITIPNNAQYMRVSFGNHLRPSVFTFCQVQNNLFDVNAIEEGTPNNAGDTPSGHMKLDVTPNKTYYMAGNWGVMTLNSNNGVLQSFNNPASIGEFTVPDGVSRIAICCSDSNVDNVVVADEYVIVGSVNVTVT